MADEPRLFMNKERAITIVSELMPALCPNHELPPTKDLVVWATACAKGRYELVDDYTPTGDLVREVLYTALARAYLTENPSWKSKKALIDENRQLRLLLAQKCAKGPLYLDDGEISDASDIPAIDFLRQSPFEISKALLRRETASLREF